MFCKECGAECSDNATYCRGCGAQFSGKPEQHASPNSVKTLTRITLILCICCLLFGLYTMFYRPAWSIPFLIIKNIGNDDYDILEVSVEYMGDLLREFKSEIRQGYEPDYSELMLMHDMEDLVENPSLVNWFGFCEENETFLEEYDDTIDEAISSIRNRLIVMSAWFIFASINLFIAIKKLKGGADFTSQSFQCNFVMPIVYCFLYGSIILALITAGFEIALTKTLSPSKQAAPQNN